MKNLESRFSAQVANFDLVSNRNKLPECITDPIIIYNSCIEDKQRFYIMAATAPSDTNRNVQYSNDQLMAYFTYNSAVSVLKQCNKSVKPYRENWPLTTSSDGT